MIISLTIRFPSLLLHPLLRLRREMEREEEEEKEEEEEEEEEKKEKVSLNHTNKQSSRCLKRASKRFKES